MASLEDAPIQICPNKGISEVSPIFISDQGKSIYKLVDKLFSPLLTVNIFFPSNLWNSLDFSLHEITGEKKEFKFVFTVMHAFI